MPTPSVIVIKYDGTDISQHVLFNSAYFESQMAALPGVFSFTCKDLDQTLSFVTGKKITLDIDGVRIWGGFLTQVTRTFAFPVDDSTAPSTVKTRQWILQGVDYNILFDKLVLRNPSDYRRHLPFVPATTSFGEVIRESLFRSYVETPYGLDFTLYVENVISMAEFNQQYADLHLITAEAAASDYALQQQGSYLRKQFENFAAFGAVYYIDANFKLHFHSYEKLGAPWGFSDTPNRSTTIGMREFEAAQDAAQISNEVFVWGGSSVALNVADGSQGAIVVGHAKNDDSIAENGRWQWSETHFDDANYKLQETVDVRALTIVKGPEAGSSAFDNLTRGLQNPVYSLRCTWFAHDVPGRVHLVPGQVVSFFIYTMGTAGHPLQLDLPLRSVRITFPELDDSGESYVRMEGSFAIQMSDQLWYWKYLKDKGGPQQIGSGTSAATTNSNPASQALAAQLIGTYTQLSPIEATDGSRTAFTLNKAYVANSTQVYVNGLLQTRDFSYAELDPSTGVIQLYFTLEADDVFWVIARTV